jgi:hypothetical protein
VQVCSADVLSSIVVLVLRDPAVVQVMAHAPVPPAATIPLLVERLAHVVPCIRRVPRRPDLRVRGPVLLHVLEVQADVLDSAHGPAALVVRLVLADYCPPAKHRVRSVQVVRHAAVGVSNIRRPKKAR